MTDQDDDEMWVHLRAETLPDGRRAVQGIVVPWDVDVVLGGRPERFEPGSLRGGVGAPLRWGHLGDPDAMPIPVGAVIRSRATDVGLWARCAMLDGPISVQAWEAVDAGLVTGASVEFRSRGAAGPREGLGRITDAELVGVALTERPVYDAARLTAVRAAPLRPPRLARWQQWRATRP